MRLKYPNIAFLLGFTPFFLLALSTYLKGIEEKWIPILIVVISFGSGALFYWIAKKNTNKEEKTNEAFVKTKNRLPKESNS
ncbi:hypothetical protein [Pelagicoccus mobilis]|uniref:Uncharacterized protein n=1 Tax=Pelagicoccus mobilis TaxID=415221 RepID=A0A934S0Q6_9BACT|nr:hypothetical protein [Pelagicoccus mobilis]MBK1876978.1 hypothetical protein [Pelagicoccus mobilis]